MSEKTLAELLNEVQRANAACDAAIAASVAAQKELEASPLLEEFGLQVIKRNNGKRKSDGVKRTRVVLDEEEVLKFIGEEEQSPKSVADKFGCSPQSATKKLKELAKAKKLQFRNEDKDNPRSKLLFKRRK